MRRAPLAVALTVIAAALASAPLGPASAASLSFSSKALTPYRTCVLTATPSTTTVVADANVRQGSPTTNFGSVTTLSLSSGSGVNQRIYLRFDLSTCSPAIASSATVRQATLRLYLSAVPTVCQTADVFRVTATWTETGITWNTQPFGTTLNNPASGSRTTFYTAGTPVGCTYMTASQYVSASVTSDVAAFVSGASTNSGWMLRDDAEGSATTRTSTYSAKELGTLAQAPQLVITYVTVP